jgi:hypothetical protein
VLPRLLVDDLADYNRSVEERTLLSIVAPSLRKRRTFLTIAPGSRSSQ